MSFTTKSRVCILYFRINQYCQCKNNQNDNSMKAINVEKNDIDESILNEISIFIVKNKINIFK